MTGVRKAKDDPGRVVDLFAGAGGWDEALCGLGYELVGIDVDPWACATARAAGHPRVEASVTELDPSDFAPIEGLVASPPCQSYSVAGKRLGRLDKSRVLACARDLAAGEDTRARHAAACHDKRSLLTVELLRWALALRPRWIAAEQVPAVVELWRRFAGLLGEHGYFTDVGVLSAERYGVPQARRRAFLIASLDGAVALPEPTHRRFDARCPDGDWRDERALLPWVSMAQALGWPVVAIDGERGPGRSRSRQRYRLDPSKPWPIAPFGAESTPPPFGYHSGRRKERVRLVTEPAPTITATGIGFARWIGNAAPAKDRQSTTAGAARLTITEASVLQGFAADYPWQGSRTRRALQVGNAVCPPVARRVLLEASRPTRLRGVAG